MSLTRRRQLLLGGLAAFLGLCSAPGCQLAPVAPQPDSVATHSARDGSVQGGWLARFGNPRNTTDPASGWDNGGGTSPGQGMVAVSMMQPVAIRAASEDPTQEVQRIASGPPEAAPASDPWHAAKKPEESPVTPVNSVIPFTAVEPTAPAPAITTNPGGGTPADGQVTPPSPPAVVMVQPIPLRSNVALRQPIRQANYVPGPSPHVVPFLGANVPKEFNKKALSSYIIEPPDTLVIQGTSVLSLPTQQIDYVNIVRADGTVGLGIYGSAFVAGLTIDQAKYAIAMQLHQNANQKLEVSEIVKELNVDVLGFNSKTYYIITDGGGYGQRVYRFYYTGNETVLDAISNIGGIPREGSRKKIWVARATPGSAHPMVLPVDWKGITQLGVASTNYQIYPGDRIFIQSDALIATDIWLNKILSPVERVMSTILLTTGIANSIHNLRNNTGN